MLIEDLECAIRQEKADAPDGSATECYIDIWFDEDDLVIKDYHITEEHYNRLKALGVEEV